MMLYLYSLDSRATDSRKRTAIDIPEKFSMEQFSKGSTVNTSKKNNSLRRHILVKISFESKNVCSVRLLYMNHFSHFSHFSHASRHHEATSKPFLFQGPSALTFSQE